MFNCTRPMTYLFWISICTLIFSGCGINTEITHSYVNPEQDKRDLEGVLVVGVSQQQKTRVKFEDEFTRALVRIGIRVQASHTLVPQDKASADEIIAAAQSANLDTILITRYMGQSTEQVYHPGTVYYGVTPAYGTAHYRGFGGYYAHAYEVTYEQPVWTNNITHTLVSDLYVTATREHLWQAVSETVQAGSKEKLRDNAIQGLIGNLKEQGLLR